MSSVLSEDKEIREVAEADKEQSSTDRALWYKDAIGRRLLLVGLGDFADFLMFG